MFDTVSDVLAGIQSVREAAKTLEDTCRFLGPTQDSPTLGGGGSAQPAAPPLLSSQQPLIILAFDEAHTLTQVSPEAEVAIQGIIVAQTPFSHLRRVLRSLRK
jgi:hypothetical protein